MNNLPGRPPVVCSIDDMENSDFYSFLSEAGTYDEVETHFTGCEKVTVDGQDYLPGEAATEFYYDMELRSDSPAVVVAESNEQIRVAAAEFEIN